jgi:hypothetical protein
LEVEKSLQKKDYQQQFLTRTIVNIWLKHHHRFLLRMVVDYILSTVVLNKNRADITRTIYTTFSQAQGQ